MAYTTTTLSGNVTLTGTSSADSITSAAAKKLSVSSYEGLDNLTLSGSATSGTVGMGGGVDTVTITTGAASKLNITLGDAADTFTSAQTDSKITVGGQGGADKFVISGASTDSYYAGGQGKDSFYATSSDGGQLGAKSTLVGGSENDTLGISSDGINVGAAAFINGQVGADKIYVNAGATATVRGGSEADTIKVTGGSSGQWMYGDKGADKLTGGAGADTILGGGGADVISGGAGTDSMSGGEGTDDFLLKELVTSADVVAKTIKDFSVAEADQFGNFSLADLTTITGSGDVGDLISAGLSTTSIAAGDSASVTKVSSAYNLGTTGTGNILTLDSSTAFTAATAADALEAGGSLELTVNGAVAENDGFFVIYDNNVDTTIGLAASTTTVSDNGTFGASTGLVVNTLTTLKGISDASTITASNILDFIA
ncbi:hemolysin-type calcium-binding region domain protein [Synechococcus sp. BIOS-U3-1]|uniref:beta strand repeat-containing protein n=1 Tax=Synechococcus sp. BIOS-U3-1 TaxID=1400865 RepID=UPI0016497840|nr:calcium-binding protein [Synechococcus sp. BIOS-U3-1]QNI57023.1 hemolysin-type calcium-binding region domain protein [Synechococcus sp. BIOS-U3-1]